MTSPARPVLVLGGTGRLGRLLRPVWPSQNGGTIWQSRRPVPNFVTCDFENDLDGLTALAQDTRAIVCLAGVTNARAGMLSSKARLQQNSTLAQAAVVAAGRAGVPRVLLASSAAVYGRAVGLLAEKHAGHDVSNYGLAKREMEQAAVVLGAAHEVEVCSMRIGNVAGADAILGQWTPPFQLDQFTDGTTPQRSYIGAETLAVVINLLTRVKKLPVCVNVANPGVVSMGALLDAAELAWTSQSPPGSAIARVEMNVERLQALVPTALPYVDPQALVQEWQRSVLGQDARQ